ncbi:hypothetical protein LUZ61_018686 [Rhynchospora tenuis]|uniref:Uncharacterized protein n=1 Tax=Rhynchospora tenuis TaxID=198213 RepID=A0AAD6EM77_9POAL|nr:hypothetical protein LUZ61_018686 [Rhynchospora tenuis]
MERGDHKPLLDESPSWSYQDNNALVEEGDTLSWRSKQKPFNWKAPAIVLGFEFLESIAFAGVSLNLVVYLADVLHGTTASNAANVDTWNGTTFLAPVLGAFLADTYLGKYKTIAISVILYLLGMLTITLSAVIPSLQPASCKGTSCPAATEFQYAVFFIALYLVAVGTGGVKSALMPLGADQYDETNPDEAQKKQSFFSLFFVAVNLGVFIAGTVVVWIQQNIAWGLGFGISLACLVVATVGFFVGTPTYRVQMPTGSPLKSVVRVLVVAFKKRHLELPKDSALLYEGEMGSGTEWQHKLDHTDGFRCLDKAAVMADPYSTDLSPATPWLSCTVTQVEEVKILLRMVPIWLTCVFYSASMCQTATTFLQQGVLMNSTIGSLSIPAASLSSIEVIFMMIFVVIQDQIIIPICRKRFQNPSGLTQLQRMGIGRFLVIFCMAAAAGLETWRLSAYKDKKSLSILWQVPQFLILAWSDVFCGIAQLEFFYGEAPESMRSLCSAFSFLAISLGYYLNSFVITLVAGITKSGGGMGWLPADLNMGHLNYYFWLWTGISAINFLVYVALSWNYTHKKIVLK